MFWRRKLKVRTAPEVDDYIRRRYEDMAVCIHLDIARDMGLYNYYAPWLDFMMSKFDLPEHIRKQNTLVITDCNGRHIGCSGAMKNTLVYYNPLPEQEQERRKMQAVGRHGSVTNKNAHQAFISRGEKSNGKKSYQRDSTKNQHENSPIFTPREQDTRLPAIPQYTLSHRSSQNSPQSGNTRRTLEACDTGKQDIINRRGWALALGKGVMGRDIITVKEFLRPQSAVDSHHLPINEACLTHKVGKKVHVEHEKSLSSGDGDRGDAVLEHSVSTSRAVSPTKRMSRICSIL